MAIVRRFDAAWRAGGLEEVRREVETCYADNSLPVVKVNALRDCLVFDHHGWMSNRNGKLVGPSNPFFDDEPTAKRLDRYAQLDGFTSALQLANYLRDADALMRSDLSAMNSARIVASRRHPSPQPAEP